MVPGSGILTRPLPDFLREILMPAVYVGLFGILGTILGAAIAGSMNFLLSRQNIKSEHRQWMRNVRQTAYKEFLSAGTSLHRACEEVAKSTDPDKARLLATPTVNFDEAYIVLQIVSDRAVFLAAREYNYWFPDLMQAALQGNGAEVKEIGGELRAARHSFLSAVRREQGLVADKELLPALRKTS
jgi:hypothetical protein